MSKNIVYNGQSFLNKVVECTGDIDNAFEMALQNNMSVSDLLTTGDTLQTTKTTDWDVVDFFANIKPATNIVQIELPKLVYDLPGEFPYSF